MSRGKNQISVNKADSRLGARSWVGFPSRQRGTEATRGTQRDYQQLSAGIREKCRGLTHQNAISLWLSVIFFSSLALPPVCSAGTEQLPACLTGVLSHQSSHSNTQREREGETCTYTHRHTQAHAHLCSVLLREERKLWIFHIGGNGRTSPMSFSGWLEMVSAALFPDEVILPCNVLSRAFTH